MAAILEGDLMTDGSVPYEHGRVAYRDFGGRRPTVMLVHGLGGNDTIRLDEANGPLPAAQLFGGSGNDTLVGGSGGGQLHHGLRQVDAEGGHAGRGRGGAPGRVAGAAPDVDHEVVRCDGRGREEPSDQVGVDGRGDGVGLGPVGALGTVPGGALGGVGPG